MRAAPAAREPSQASFDPEQSFGSDTWAASGGASRAAPMHRASFASNMSYDPEALHSGGSHGPRNAAGLSTVSNGNVSYDPEQLAFGVAPDISSQSSYDPEHQLVSATVTTMQSYDPDGSSLASATSYDPERQSVYSKSNTGNRSYDPERSHHSFASEASFDPERSTWGSSSLMPTGTAHALGEAQTEMSIDPETEIVAGRGPGYASPHIGRGHLAVDADARRAGQDLSHVSALLREVYACMRDSMHARAHTHVCPVSHSSLRGLCGGP